MDTEDNFTSNIKSISKYIFNEEYKNTLFSYIENKHLLTISFHQILQDTRYKPEVNNTLEFCKEKFIFNCIKFIALENPDIDTFISIFSQFNPNQKSRKYALILFTFFLLYRELFYFIRNGKITIEDCIENDALFNIFQTEIEQLINDKNNIIDKYVPIICEYVSIFLPHKDAFEKLNDRGKPIIDLCNSNSNFSAFLETKIHGSIIDYTQQDLNFFFALFNMYKLHYDPQNICSMISNKFFSMAESIRTEVEKMPVDKSQSYLSLSYLKSKTVETFKTEIYNEYKQFELDEALVRDLSDKQKSYNKENVQFYVSNLTLPNEQLEKLQKNDLIIFLTSIITDRKKSPVIKASIVIHILLKSKSTDIFSLADKDAKDSHNLFKFLHRFLTRTCLPDFNFTPGEKKTIAQIFAI